MKANPVMDKNAGVKCPACHQQRAIPVFNKARLPHYVLERHYTREDALGAKTGDVDVVFCDACGFAFNRSFDPSQMNYVVDYERSRSHSPYFERYLDTVCHEIKDVCSLDGGTLVEVGCGDGYLLMKLRALIEFDGWGFEPNLKRVDRKPSYKDLRFVEDYYKPDILKRTPALILRHILEHQGDVHAFLESVLSSSKQLPNQVYIEIPSWEWIVDRDQVYAFSYEHCSYFTRNALQVAMAMHGYETQKNAFTFEDEYIQYFGKREVQSVRINSWDCQESLISQTHAFIERIPVILERLRMYFAEAADTVLWGAAGKGTTLLNVLDVDYKVMPYVVDTNTRRHDTYIPVTGQHIVAPEFLKKIKPHRVLSTNPSYMKEIEARLDFLDVHAEIIVVE